MEIFRVKKYKSEFDYSYALGAAPTFELIHKNPESIYKVYLKSSYKSDEVDFFDLCSEKGISCEANDNVFDRLLEKGNTFVIGVFMKYLQKLDRDSSHIALVNPSDMGNFGTIIRTGLGFGFKNYAIIENGMDYFDPKAVRASMGACFGVNILRFKSFEEYIKNFPEHDIYSFMLKGSENLDILSPPKEKFTLVFGNEATGLPDHFSDFGKSVRIVHNNEIDSLNLSIAFGIAAHAFANFQ